MLVFSPKTSVIKVCKRLIFLSSEALGLYTGKNIGIIIFLNHGATLDLLSAIFLLKLFTD